MPGPVSVTPRWSCRFRAAGPINPASLGRELDRVVDQIGDRLDQQIPVATHIETLVKVNAQGDILVLGDRFINVADFAQLSGDDALDPLVDLLAPARKQRQNAGSRPS